VAPHFAGKPMVPESTRLTDQVVTAELMKVKTVT
jgi:hypothetical protein